MGLEHSIALSYDCVSDYLAALLRCVRQQVLVYACIYIYTLTQHTHTHTHTHRPVSLRSCAGIRACEAGGADTENGSAPTPDP